MTNADKFKSIFGIYATELWAKSEEEFIEWLNSEDAVSVRHGTFIGTEFDGYADGCPAYYEWKCSECGCIFEDDEPTYKFCPNCGAKMEVE